MNNIPFLKYQGTGNDFVLIDNRLGIVDPQNHSLFARMCHRRFGIGADGVILLEKPGPEAPRAAFHMRYYNADGYEGTMCGNGGRCIVRFAESLGLAKGEVIFSATDGLHEARLFPDQIELRMAEPGPLRMLGAETWEIDTGSPHFVQRLKLGLAEYELETEGRRIRNLDHYQPRGINVNFFEETPGGLSMRTYERGVEAETYSCGTGATAVALVWLRAVKGLPEGEVAIQTPGGLLTVRLAAEGREAWLCGPAERVFKGEYPR